LPFKHDDGAINTPLLTKSSQSEDNRKKDTRQMSALEMLNREKHLVL